MANIYQIAQTFRSDLLQRDQQAASRMITAYGQTWQQLHAQLDALTAKMQAATDSGQGVSLSWLYREHRLESLLAQTEQQMMAFARYAEASVIQQQREAVTSAQQHAQQLALFGVDTSGVRIGEAWSFMPASAVETLVGHLQDGSPLAALFASFGADASEAMKKALVTGIATGQNPRQIAREVRRTMGINLTRALTISRTETLRAYREASIENYRQNSDVVQAWEWMAARSPRTCAMCLAMDGTIHPLDEVFGSHPNCRCCPVPVTSTWKELGLSGPIPIEHETGEEWFAGQTETMQTRILGPAKQEAYRQGKITLPQLVGYKDDPPWGPVRWELSLKDALAAAKNVNGPQTAPVSKAFKIVDGEPGKPLRNAIAAIDAVHTDGSLPVIPLGRDNDRQREGAMMTDTRTDKVVKILVSKSASHPELTTVHETGHFLDKAGIGPSGPWASVTDPQLNGWRKAIVESSAIRHLAALRDMASATITLANGIESRIPVNKAFVDYLLQPWEVWARSYAQFIAVKSRNPELMEQLKQRVDEPFAQAYTMHWRDDDFAPIAEAMELLFQQLGWMP